MTDTEGPPTIDGPSPGTAVIDDYFARLADAARAAGASGWQEAAADLQAHLHEDLDGTAGTRADALRLLADLGTPGALAAAFAESEDEPGERRFHGIPFDLRNPSSRQYADRMWNPLDRRILVPKAVGVGWTINFGGLAVRTRLVRPDDEDVPFGAVPSRVVAATLLLPLAVLVSIGLVTALSWAQLPARVPVHWGVSGDADGYASRGLSLSLLFAIPAVSVAGAVWVHLRRRPALNRVGASALSLSVTTLSLALLVQTLFTVSGGLGLWPLWLGIACSLAFPFLLLVGVSRMGRDAEQRRDLSRISNKDVSDER